MRYGDGTLCQPSLHYQTDVPTAGSEPDPADVASTIWGHLGNFVPATVPTYVHIDSLVVSEQVLKPDIGAAGAVNIDIAGTLPGSSEDLPRELVAIINLHTNVASRSARGYFTLPGPGGETFTQGRLFTNEYVNAGNSLAGVLDDQLDIGTFQVTHLNPVVYSRKRHQAHQDPFTFRVQSAKLNLRPKWRRSRGTTP